MSRDTWRFATRAIHEGLDREDSSTPSMPPIFQTSAFSYADSDSLREVFEGHAYGHVYSRISNPTVSVFEQKLASLEGGVGAIAFASGMAALTGVALALTEPGDEILASKTVFGGTILLMNTVLRRTGVKVTFFSNDDVDELPKLINERTRFVLVESIGNPRLDVADVHAISKHAHDSGVPLVVDSTLTTAYLLPAKERGADLVVYSGTKYINGSGTAMSGAVVDLGTFDWRSYSGDAVREFSTSFGARFAFLALMRKQIVQNTGATLSPFSAFLCTIGLETLSIRMDRHCTNAMHLAEFLSGEGLKVSYPGLPTDRYHEIAAQQLEHGFGGLVTFRAGTRQRALEIIDGLTVPRHMTNMGEAKTLVLHPETTIFHGCSAEEIADAGVTGDLIRISVGLEDIEDLKEDFANAIRSEQHGAA